MTQTASTSPDDSQRPSVRRALFFSLVQRYAAFAAQLVLSVVLARLLTPTETGIFSLAAAVVALGHLLREFGVSDYIISRRELTPTILRAAFTATLAIAWVVAAILWLLSWPLAALYGEPGVRQAIQLLCVSFALLPFGAVSFALLTRELRFGYIALLQSASTLVGTLTTLLCAWNGASYLSMAWGAIAANASIILLLLVFHRGSIALMPTLSGLREVLGFGSTLTTARFLDQIASRSSDFIVSGALGFHAGGIYGKANTLNGSFHEFFNSAVMRVATPAFARTDAKDSLALRGAYVRATVVLSAFLWTFFPLMAVFAEEIVLVLFGAKWIECVLIVQIAAVASIFHAPFLLAGSILTALGAASEQLRVQLYSTPLTVLALIVGAPFGLPMAVLAVNLAGFVRLALINGAMRRLSDIGGLFVLRRLGSSAMIGLATLVMALSIRATMLHFGLSPAWIVTIGLTLSLVVAGIVSLVVRHPVVAEMAPLVRRVRRLL